MTLQGLGQYISVIGRAAALYTDVFLLFSGLLTSYAIIGRLQRKQSLRLFQEYIGRFMRIVPTFGALILFCTYILPIIGSGPQWNLVVNQHAENCKQYWWRNLLFIHNYYGFDKMVRHCWCNRFVLYLLSVSSHFSVWHILITWASTQSCS